MAEFIVMPKMGLTMTEGIISNWRKKEGDSVKKGDIIFDVETDKLTNEFDAKKDGILRKILVDNGTVPVLAPVAIIGEDDEDISELVRQTGASAKDEGTDEKQVVNQEKGPAVPAAARGGRVKASPRAKKIAQDLGVDIFLVAGTGPDGSITEDDVRNYTEQEKKKVSPAAAIIADKLGVDVNNIEKDTRIMKEDVVRYKISEELEKYASPQEFRRPMSTMRRVISERMLESKRTSPEVSYNIKVDTTAMRHLREDVKDEVKISYNDILIKIVSETLLEFPLLNSSVDGNEIITRNYVNMGVAVALTDGLIVPVVKYANAKGLKDIAKEAKELAEKARNNELSPDDLKGGTFTISNIGMYGIDSFTPIINQPQAAILGINAIADEVKVVDGEIAIRPMMNISLTADHRVVDGAVAAEFMSRLKKYIEKPGFLLL